MDIVDAVKPHISNLVSDWLDQRFHIALCEIYQHEFACLLNPTERNAYFSYDPFKNSWKRTAILLHTLSAGI